MKRVLIVFSLLIVIWFGYTVVTHGFTSEKLNLNITSYKGLDEQSAELAKEVESYNNKNQNEYEAQLVTLNNTIKRYKDSKSKYEEVIAEYATDEDSSNQETNADEMVIVAPITAYKIDFLLAVLGNYAEKEGIDIDISLETSSTQDTNASVYGYILCNVRMTVKGEYINISNLISDIENDDELGFEISSFAMVSKQATFVLKDVPIDSSTLIQTTTSSSDDSSQETTTEGTDSTNTNTTNTTAVNTNTENIATENTTTVNSSEQNANTVNSNTVQ